VRIIDRLLDRSIARRVDEAVRRALADHRDLEPHTAPEDPLQRMLVHGDRSRLHIDPSAVVNNALFNLSGGSISIGAYAFFGHNVSVLTGSHDVNKFGADRQKAVAAEGQDVVIGEGVWVASHAIVVGPCRIGPNSVVGVGSVVLDEVEAYTIVAGSPAKPVRTIDHPDDG
jgi:acetyltransferase-like isoleucine patch superfamily enzyme